MSCSANDYQTVYTSCRPGVQDESADPEDHASMISQALESSFVFRGIDKKRLHEVIRCYA